MMAARQAQGPRLSELLAGMRGVLPVPDIAVHGLSLDSRKTRSGDLFLACAGSAGHGGDHVAAAVRAGAGGVLVDSDFPRPVLGTEGVPVYPVADLGAKAGLIAARFYGHPARDLHVIAVTGTNGKTSVSHLSAQALSRSAGLRPCAVLGTVGYGLIGQLQPATTTTPDPIELHRRLFELRARGAKALAMEVSSHALHQARTAGVEIDVAVLTNLSRDHLDYHGSMDAYAEAKRLLFQRPELQAAVLNHDDPFGRDLARRLRPGVRGLAYGMREAEHIRSQPGYILATALSTAAGGCALLLETSFGAGRLESRLFGRFNAYNLMAALGVLLVSGVPLAEALEGLSRALPVPGRMECQGGHGGVPLVVVDYAHTPDALEQALRCLREARSGRLVCVFGCGGERDRGKRPLMGAVAEALADRVIVTNDNPRREQPSAIIDQVLPGLRRPEQALVEPDRANAIAAALDGLSEQDTVLIAGKGHEDYQDIGGERLPWSDREWVQYLIGGAAP
ncbi:MAG: UDP-N-acetylmuramoyl-L-alanyl-D-glutamate--2,6-diaminopimelate ligase [Gammaproteobacteria bacterium]